MARKKGTIAGVQKEVVPTVVTGLGTISGIMAARMAKTVVTDKVGQLQSYPEVASVISIGVGLGVQGVNKNFGAGWLGGAAGMLLMQLLGRVMGQGTGQIDEDNRLGDELGSLFKNGSSSGILV